MAKSAVLVVAASRWLLNSVRGVRGAPTHIAGDSVGKLVPPIGSALRPRCRRGQVALPCKTVIDKVPVNRAAVSRFSPQVLTAPADHLRRTWQPPAGRRFLVHCAAASVSASSPLFKVSPSFKTGSHTVAGIMRSAITPRRPSRHWGCRLTNRCSDPGRIKCLAAGEDLPTSMGSRRARVLNRRRAVAELGR